MSVFRTHKEKQLWFYVIIILVGIFSVLAIGRPLQEMLRDQNTQAVFFLIGMLLTAATIVIHGLKVRPGKVEWVIWLGLAAVYTMFIFRLGAPERSHVIEYSVLAVFILSALIERQGEKGKYLRPGLIAFVLTTLIGTIDEGIQVFLPDRVFDPQDILFNSLAALMAVGGSILLRYVRHKFSRSHQISE
ncbi:MAG: VanZ family protein [Saprospiraceae bacterium]|nr:VanZ family protein [Saprospiraceae bacterium]